MNYKNIFIIGLAMAMAGCMPKHKITTKNFIATESICIDGVVVNIDAAGCNNMLTTQTDGEPGIRIRCEDTDQSSPWTFVSFHIVSSTMDINIPAWEMICSDPSATIYYSVPRTN